MKKKEKFSVGDIVKVRETSAIGDVRGIYKVGRKEMLVLKINGGGNVNIPSESCRGFN